MPDEQQVIHRHFVTHVEKLTCLLVYRKLDSVRRHVAHEAGSEAPVHALDPVLLELGLDEFGLVEACSALGFNFDLLERDRNECGH